MAVTDAEVRTLLPGDQIVIISEEEAKARGYWDNKVLEWVGDPDGTPSGMNARCGEVLTVSRIYLPSYPGGFCRVYVKETGFWWRDNFIAAIIRQDSFEALEDAAIDALLSGGV